MHHPMVSIFLALALPLALSAPAPAQALRGKRIVLSPGHGYYWHPSLGWTTQRPLIDGLIEDIHTNEIIIDHLLPYLEGSGAQVIACRARSRTTEEHILDNDDGYPTYRESGPWFTSASSGWNGGSYRFAITSSAGGSRASFRVRIARSDRYPLYLAFRSSSNRTHAARVEIQHAGGLSVRTVDQSRDGLRWVYVGTFPWRAGEEALVTLSSASASPGAIIADAVKIGDGMGSISRGGSSSGKPRWQECSRYQAEYFGAPASVYNSSSGDDHSDDVTCRPRYGEWWGADLYLSLHTNAGGGRGTSTYIYSGGATAGSSAFRDILHARVIGDLRAEWDPSWNDHGRHSANFGELRLLSTMPGCLIELAFHDDIGGDVEALHHPRFRHIAARAMYRAIATYLAPGQPFILDPPRAVAMANDGAGGLRISWLAVPGAHSYRVRISTDGFGFDDGQIVTGTALTLPALPHGAVRYARIACINAGGTGPDSEPVGARRAPSARSPLLIVDGFDRRDRYVKELENPRAWIPWDGTAISAVLASGYPFDSCSNEAVTSSLVRLPEYACCGWILGEESTVDETFSAAEQTLVTAYLALGGHLFFSGAEVGWDLDLRGSVSDRAFYENVLGQDYVADDAGVYTTAIQLSGPLAFLPPMRFDDGSAGIYDVDYPDAIQPSTSGGGQIALRYSNGLGAAVLSGNGRVLGLGFPLEALVSADYRRQLMERILDLLCPLGIKPQGSPQLGRRTSVDLHLPSSANLLYLAAAALDSSPGIALGDGRILPLNPDPLFQLSLGAQAVFLHMSGTLDPQGRAQLQIDVPADPLLHGFSWTMAALSIDPATGQIPALTSWRRLTIP